MKTTILITLLLTFTLPGQAEEADTPKLHSYNCRLSDGEKEMVAKMNIYWHQSEERRAHTGIILESRTLSGKGLISFTNEGNFVTETVSLNLPFESKRGYLSAETFIAHLSEPFSRYSFDGFAYGSMMKTNQGYISCGLEQ